MSGVTTVRVRALIGEWEGQEPMFLGGIQHDQYEAILEEDAHDGTFRWEEITDDWKRLAPSGITETREVDVTLQVPADLFLTQQLSAEVDEETTDAQ